MKLRKILAGAVMFLVLTSSVFAAKAKKIKVVTTIFPEYDWVREIVGENNKNVDLTLLVGNGVDLHSYQPSIQDIAKISTADIFIYVGGESDGWVKDALANATNKNMKVINLMEVLEGQTKVEEMKEGMQASEHHHDDEAEEEYDEHVWLSVRFAKTLCAVISKALCDVDSANSSSYKANLKAYTEKLDNLDAKFSTAVKNGNKKTLLFGDRFPFRYFVEDYKLDYYAAFVGCSAETEASFETVAFLAKKVDELGLNSVIKIESGDGKIARTIVENSKKKNAKVLTLDSIQSTTLKQAKAGASYLKIMEENLKVIEEALK